MKKEEREEQLFIYGVITCFVICLAFVVIVCLTKPCCF